MPPLRTKPKSSASGRTDPLWLAVGRFLQRGWCPLPLPYRSKKPLLTGWTELRPDGMDFHALFPDTEMNIGVLLGEASNGLVDLDLDCKEARAVAPFFAPATDCGWGRQSAPDSHRLYVVVDPPDKATEKWNDPVTDGCILELRSTGGQTVAPPSVYPAEPEKGKPAEEKCLWTRTGDPAQVELTPLMGAADCIAAAALLGRYWPEQGGRHDAALALAGGLFRAGWGEAEILHFVQAVCAAAGDDEEDDRLAAARTTKEKHAAGENVTGWPRLAETLKQGEAVVKAVCKWLEIHRVGAASGEGGLTGARIILEHYREIYRPVFRRGNSVHCADGRDVPMGEAVAVPNSKLIAKLATAVDAPVYKGGAVNQGGLPGFFGRWAKVAWGDLLAELPDEDTAELGQDAPAREEFVRLVREAMLSEVQLGETIDKSGSNQTRIERRSLIDWCQRFAREGPWRSIRSKKCWCKIKTLPGGEVPEGDSGLVVAIRHELFSQLGADRRLREMGANTFARRASRYGVGVSTREDRPHGVSAIVLDPKFVADLIADLPDEGAENES